MLKNQDGEKTTPNKAAKAAIVEAIGRIMDTVPEGILEDDAFKPEWCATKREEKEFYEQLRKRCNGVLNYLGQGWHYPKPEESPDSDEIDCEECGGLGQTVGFEGQKKITFDCESCSGRQ